MSTNTKPSIVFCHGLWADGSCFSKVIPTLQADGHEVIAVQYGLNSYADDVATVKRTLGRVNSPAILVGHSYGGATITGAGTDEPRRRIGLHRRRRPRCSRDRAEPTQQIPDRNLLPNRGRRRTRLGEAGRHQVLRGRPFRAGAEAGLGDPLPARRRPARAAEARSGRLEIEAELVHSRSEGPDGASRSSALSGEAHERDHGRDRQQPRHHAFPA